LDLKIIMERYLKWAPPGVATWLFNRLKGLDFVKRTIDKEYEEIFSELDASLKPYRRDFKTYAHIPDEGVDRTQILESLERLREREEDTWKDGYVSGAVYHGNREHIDFLNKVYALNSQSNPLHSDVWPSAAKFEAEIVAMTAGMLSGDLVKDSEVCGTVTSGGSESIMLAMKTYRDQARDKRGIKRPNIVMPETAHAAFDKAGQYFKIKVIKTKLGAGFKADPDETRSAVDRNTIAVVGSAPAFPHGIVDPIGELSELARERGVGFHTDACLGGFMLPWAEELGYDVPEFDFRLPGVTSISADTHKYGYAAKGASVVLYRNKELRRYQYFTTTEWPGGLYFSPTFAGSRPGALSAVCWAAMVSIGKNGYIEAADKILRAAESIKAGIRETPELKILGEPLWVIAFTSDELNIYQVLENMTRRGWRLNGLYKPPCVHICVTLRHTSPGVAERFTRDLKDSVKEVKENPDKQEGMAPVYGMAATIPARGMVDDLLRLYMDKLYET
jgi:glutamate/tyrosine decarboxylase-like PLP-dependent enzyme